MLKQSQKNSGFTLIEVIVSVAIFAMIFVALVALLSNMFTAYKGQSLLLSDEDQARRLSFQMISELRDAQTGADGSYSINQAGDQQIIFFSGTSGSSSVKRIRYYTSGGALYKGVITASGSPPTYVVANEQVTLVQSNIANGATPIFIYYDGNYDGASSTVALTQPVNVTLVKFVKLNMKIYNKAGVVQTNTYTITAGAAIRNLKTNLGS